MGSIRNSDTMGSLFMAFRFQGQRCREYTALTDTPINRKKLAKVLAKIESEINAGTFVYANYFPNSKALKRFARADLEKAAPSAVTPRRTMRLRSLAPSVAARILASSSWVSSEKVFTP